MSGARPPSPTVARPVPAALTKARSPLTARSSDRVGAAGSAASAAASSRSPGRSMLRAKSLAVPVGTTASGTEALPGGAGRDADRPVAAGDHEAVEAAGAGTPSPSSSIVSTCAPWRASAEATAPASVRVPDLEFAASRMRTGLSPYPPGPRGTLALRARMVRGRDGRPSAHRPRRAPLAARALRGRAARPAHRRVRRALLPRAASRARGAGPAAGVHALWRARGVLDRAGGGGRRAGRLAPGELAARDERRGTLTYLLNVAIKNVVRRKRPLFEELPQLISTPTSLSFPSAHASSSFAAARGFSPLLPAAPLYAVATAMAASRVALGVHYPSDIVAGARRGPRSGAWPGEGRHRRHAQRGEVVALQRAHPGRRGGGQLPVHDHRAKRRDRPGAPTSGSTRSPRLIGASSIVPDTIAFHDIAGLVARRPRGRGAGQQVPGQHPRDRRRSCTSSERTTTLVIIHPEGSVDPARGHRDDRDRARLRRSRAGGATARARRAHRARRETRRRSPRRHGCARWSTGCKPAAPRARLPPPAEVDRRADRPSCSPPSLSCSSPTSTRATTPFPPRSPPTPPPPARSPSRCPRGWRRSCPSSTKGDAATMRGELGVGESGPVACRRRRVRPAGPDRVLHGGRREAPRRSWHLRKGLTAWHAAGEIHSDIQRGFVRAEVIAWSDPARRRRLRGRARARDAAPRRSRLRRWPTAT